MIKKRKFGILALFLVLSISIVYAVTSYSTTGINMGSPITVEGVVSSATVTTPNQTWLSFNKTGNVIVNKSYVSYFNTTNFTILISFNRSSKTTDTVASLGHGQSNIGGWRIYPSNNGWIYFYGTNLTGGSYNCRPGDVDRYDNKFHYYIVTFDTTNGVRWFFDNSSNLASGSCTYNTYLNITNQIILKLGGTYDTSQPFNGSIKYFYFLNRTLNQSEIYEYYPYANLKGIVKGSGSAYNTYIYRNGTMVGLGSNKTYISTNDGSTWINTANISTNSTAPYGIFIDNNSIAYASWQSDGRLWSSTGNLAVWTVVLNFTHQNSTMWESKGMTQDNDGNLYVGQYATGTSPNQSVVWKKNNSGGNWFVVYNSTNSRHVHFIQNNPYNNKLYLSLGDFNNERMLLVSSDGGITWSTLLNGTVNYGLDPHPTGVAFINETAYFVSDILNYNHIYKTSNDIDFEIVYNLTTVHDVPFYWIIKDNKGWLYAGTSEANATRNATVYYSRDYVNWELTEEYNVSYGNGTATPTNVDQYNRFHFLAGSNGRKFQGFSSVNYVPTSMVAWRISENSGNTLYDLSGNSNNGTIYGATWQTDGQTRTLGESADYTKTESDTTTSFTITNSDYLYSYYTLAYSVYTNERAAVNDLCSSYTSSLSNFGGKIPTGFIILGVILIMGFIGLLVYTVMEFGGASWGDIVSSLDSRIVITLAIGVMVFVFVAFATLFGISAICSMDF